MRVIIPGRYKAKKWVRRWMFWPVLYPYYFCANLYLSHRVAVDDVRVMLSQYRFEEDKKC